MVNIRYHECGERGDRPETPLLRFFSVGGCILVNDAHCHFFSDRFFELTAAQAGLDKPGGEVAASLGWDPPGSASELADRWAAELDRHQVARAALIASAPGDEDSVAEAVRRHPGRFAGFFMVNPNAGDAAARVERAFDELRLQTACLFPAMHGFRLDEAAALKVFELAAKRSNTAVFVHCGALTVGIRKRLGLPSRFDIRLGNPLDLLPVAAEFPELPILIPHFGAGFFREALMLADLRNNVHFDTSSSNSWVKYHPNLGLEEVFRRALDVLGSSRLLFGSDSSFFPRGWQKPVWDRQLEAFTVLGLDEAARNAIAKSNFDRLFPVA